MSTTSGNNVTFGAPPRLWHEWLPPSLLLSVSALFVFPIHVAATRAGFLLVSPTELLSIALFGLLGWQWLRRRYRPAGGYLAMTIVMMLFLLSFLIVCVVRWQTGDTITQSQIALRTTVLALSAFFIFDARWERPQRALMTLVLFNAALNLGQLPNWNDLRQSPFLGSSMIYVTLLLALTPVNAWVLRAPPEGRLGKALRIVAALNIGVALIAPLLSGSRAGSSAAFVVVALSAIIVGSRETLRLWLGAGVAAAVGTMVVWAVNPSDAALGLYRLFPPPAHLRAEISNSATAAYGVRDAQNGRGSSAAPQTLVELTDYSRVQSNNIRSQLWSASIESIRESPFIGTGQVFFEFDDPSGPGVQAPHNFVLEHVNAYGLIGFVPYSALFVVALYPTARDLRRASPTGRANLMAGVTAFGVLSVSLVQPTMLHIAVTMILWLDIGAFRALAIASDTAAQKDVKPSLPAAI